MSTRSDDEIVARLRASLDELSAGIPRPAPPLDDRRDYTAEVAPLNRRRRWAPAVVAVAGLAAAVALAVVLATRDGDEAPLTTEPAATAPPLPSTSSVTPAPAATGPLPVVTLDLPGATAGPTEIMELPPPGPAISRVYATGGAAPERVLVVQTTESEFDPPSPEGDYTMDPVGAPTGQAWILRPVLDEPGNHVPVDDPVVWWSTGNGRELVKVGGQGLSDAELAAVLADLQRDGDAWAYAPAGFTDLQLLDPADGARSTSLTEIALPSGEKATIEVRTGTQADLLEQANFWLDAPAGTPATATLPDGTTAIVRSDPGSFHVLWRSGETAIVRLAVRQTEDLPAVLAAIRTNPG